MTYASKPQRYLFILTCERPDPPTPSKPYPSILMTTVDPDDVAPAMQKMAFLPSVFLQVCLSLVEDRRKAPYHKFPPINYASRLIDGREVMLSITAIPYPSHYNMATPYTVTHRMEAKL